MAFDNLLGLCVCMIKRMRGVIYCSFKCKGNHLLSSFPNFNPTLSSWLVCERRTVEGIRHGPMWKCFCVNIKDTHPHWDRDSQVWLMWKIIHISRVRKQTFRHSITWRLYSPLEKMICIKTKENRKISLRYNVMFSGVYFFQASLLF